MHVWKPEFSGFYSFNIKKVILKIEIGFNKFLMNAAYEAIKSTNIYKHLFGFFQKQLLS